MNVYIVYAHVRQDNRRVFYIGQSVNRGRAYDEFSRNDAWKEIVNKTFFDVVILKSGLTKEEALKYEIEFIELLGYDNLTNGTTGGLGSSGLKHTKETKSALSKAMRGRKIPLTQIIKQVENRRLNSGTNYVHIATGEIIKGLRFACDKYGIKYKSEFQRIKRNSSNRSFNKIENTN